jgi:hypothetical protein
MRRIGIRLLICAAGIFAVSCSSIAPGYARASGRAIPAGMRTPGDCHQKFAARLPACSDHRHIPAMTLLPVSTAHT